MQKARSGLAAAAARWQLVDAPEGESSLQSRLYEAERRAQDAEASAQDAQAALARTLLDAARVEAVVTARMKARSDAELEALRAQLESLKHPSAKDEVAPDSDRGGGADCAAVAAQDPSGTAVTDRMPDTSEAPDADAAPPATLAERDAAADHGVDAKAAPALRISDEDRPEWARPQEAPAAEPNVLRFLPTARIAFLAVVGIVAVISYYVTVSIMDGRDRRTVVAGGIGAHPVAGALQDTGTDPKSIAEASASLDAELARLAALSRKVESLKTAIATRSRTLPQGAPAVEQSSSGAGANWLLYMPVERAALVDYLAGRSWPGMQTAARPGLTGAVRR